MDETVSEMRTGHFLTPEDILDLRAYERERESFRSSVIALKRLRRVPIGPLVTVVFENATTMRFQVQEMARAERMMSDEQIAAELEVYNALIPRAGELSLTLFLELTSEEALREWLPKLVGIERSVLLRLGEGEGFVRAAVEEGHDSQLTREETTASVHYVRFALDEAGREQFRSGPVVIAIDHPAYRHEATLSPETRRSLLDDW